MEERKVMTAEDVARLLLVNTDTVYRLARKGEIPSFKVGRRVRFHRDKSACHPDDPFWVSYQDGQLEVTCCVCQKTVAVVAGRIGHFSNATWSRKLSVSQIL